ncbi:Vps62-related protein [Streptomyces hygroscopicus]|uniref:Vps62-related protein n=1 Tax=Streptomyces hygroscopicus TaxID=1912 RepID=UPI00099CEDFE|nr:Vps62-related protein [Streptomyces hygroscopicus]
MPISTRYGALDIAVTSSFHTLWTDRGSKADKDFSAHMPLIGLLDGLMGWKILGHVGRPHHEDLGGKFAVVIARGANPADELLKPPDDFELIWRDKGSGAKADGSVWRPVPPGGYVALSDVWTDSWDKPSASRFACVRKAAVNGHSYVREGVIGPLIWNDKGSGADWDCSTWSIRTPPYPLDSTDRLLLDVGGQVANRSWDKPNRTVWVLDLPAVVIKKNPAPAPVQTGFAFPEPRETLKVLDRQVTVPCTVISDPGKTPAWQVQNSPFYTLERRTSFYAQMHNHNQTSETQNPSQEVVTGVSNSNSQEFSRKTSITVTAKAGIEIKGLSAGIETSVAQELGYSTRTEVTYFQENRHTWTLNTAPGTAAVAWSPRHDIRAVRADGDPVGQASLIFDIESRTYTQCPPAGHGVGQGGILVNGTADTSGDLAPFGPVENNLPDDTTGLIIP